MANETIDPTKINEIADAQVRVNEATAKGTELIISNNSQALNAFRQQQEAQNKLSDATLQFNDAISVAASSSQDFQNKLSESNTKSTFTELIFKSLSVSANELSDVVRKLKGHFSENSKETELMTGALAAASTQVFVAENSLGKLGDVTSISTKSVNDMSGGLETLSKTLGVFGKLGAIPKEFLSEPFAKFFEATKNVTEFENSLISLNARFAGFGDNETRMNFITNMDDNLHNFTDTNRNLANTLGLSIGEMTNYTSKLMEIPGAYKSVIDDAMKTGHQMTALEAATRTARGTTGDFKDSFESMNLQFREFGDRSGEKGLDVLARTYDISQRLGVSFTDIKTPVAEITKEFAAMGENSEGATRLVEGLGGALLGIKGVGVDVMGNIVKEVSSKIEGMTIAQKAFLSAQTGGSGGLRGAYEIDLLERQGKMDEVYQKMEQSLKNMMGGRIVTLEDAARSQEAAAQMTKQIAFLTNGPYGSIVKDDSEAKRLLEAFSKGTKPTEDKAGEAINNAFKADSLIQSRQALSLQQIMNNALAILQDVNQLNAKNLRALDKELLGGKNMNANSDAFSSGAIDNVMGRGPTYYSPAAALIQDLKKINANPMNIGPETYNAPEIPAPVLRDARTGNRSSGHEFNVHVNVEGVLKDTSGNKVATLEQVKDINDARSGF